MTTSAPAFGLFFEQSPLPCIQRRKLDFDASDP
jgi:hypothetical protein